MKNTCRVRKVVKTNPYRGEKDSMKNEKKSTQIEGWRHQKKGSTEDPDKVAGKKRKGSRDALIET